MHSRDDEGVGENHKLNLPITIFLGNDVAALVR